MSPTRGTFLPFALITLGVVFLLGNWLPESSRGGLVVLGLGLAFTIGRATTGRYGYAVPAGILIGIGSYLTLRDGLGAQWLQGGGWFFVLLGLGFGLTYLIGGQPTLVWPLFPATVLTLLGMVVFGVNALGPLASLSWIVQYWPAVLVAIGAWFLLRDQLPESARQPVAAVGGVALLGYGVLAAASTVAAGGTFATSGFAFGAPYSDSISLDGSIAAGQVFSVSNPTGRTTVRGGDVARVQVTANRRFAVAGQPPEVRLEPTSTGSSGLDLTVGALPRGPFGTTGRVDLEIVVPSGVEVVAKASSGNLDIGAVDGPVRAETSSGDLKLANVGGAVQVNTSSGDIEGRALQRVQQVSTSSGDVTIEGLFAEQSQVRTTSGDVELRLLPGSAVQVQVNTRSGDIERRGLSLGGQQEGRDSLSGTVGQPAAGAVLTIETTSGDVLLRQ